MRKKGFTLIELLASLAIASLLIVTAYVIFGLSIKASKNTYANELDYKSSSLGFTYVENVIRRAYKIELTNDIGETNCKFYLVNVSESDNKEYISTYRFLTDDSQTTKEKTLYAEIINVSNKGDSDDSKLYVNYRASKVPIAKCNDLYLYYDAGNETVKIIINKDNPRLRYETLINVGKRLWKRDLYLYWPYLYF